MGLEGARGAGLAPRTIEEDRTGGHGGDLLAGWARERCGVTLYTKSIAGGEHGGNRGPSPGHAVHRRHRLPHGGEPTRLVVAGGRTWVMGPLRASGSAGGGVRSPAPRGGPRAARLGGPRGRTPLRVPTARLRGRGRLLQHGRLPGHVRARDDRSRADARVHGQARAWRARHRHSRRTGPRRAPRGRPRRGAQRREPPSPRGRRGRRAGAGPRDRRRGLGRQLVLPRHRRDVRCAAPRARQRPRAHGALPRHPRGSLERRRDGRGRRAHRSRRAVRPACRSGEPQPQLRALPRWSLRPLALRHGDERQARLPRGRWTLEPGETWRQESVIGSVFAASYERGAAPGAIAPTIVGEAHVTARATLLLEDEIPSATASRPGRRCRDRDRRGPPRHLAAGQHVVVIGGGVIGAMCARSLVERGLRVTVVDRERFGAACSHGNCGYVCPSHVLPLCQPGAVRRCARCSVATRPSRSSPDCRGDGSAGSGTRAALQQRDMLEAANESTRSCRVR